MDYVIVSDDLFCTVPWKSEYVLLSIYPDKKQYSGLSDVWFVMFDTGGY